MLMWHRRLWLIDQGAALYFHHRWDNYRARSREPFPLIKDHVLLSLASALEEADAKLSARLTSTLIDDVVKLIPDAWLLGDAPFSSREQQRAAYVEYLLERLAAPRAFWGRRFVHDHRTYDYAIIRVVPKVEREEFINAGVIVSCPARKFLAARIELDEQRLRALDPAVDVEAIRAHLAAIPVICAGGAQAGPLGRLSQRERFHWLAAPRSTAAIGST